MRQVVEIVFVIAACPALAYRLVAWDEARLPAFWAAQAWPRASRLSALVGLVFLFGPITVPFALAVYFGRTRMRWWLWAAIGFVAGIAILALLELVAAGIDALPDDAWIDWAVLVASLGLAVHELLRNWRPWDE